MGIGNPVGTQPPTAAPPHFRPMPIVAKQSPISTAAELLFLLLNQQCETTEGHSNIFALQNEIGQTQLIGKEYCRLDGSRKNGCTVKTFALLHPHSEEIIKCLPFVSVYTSLFLSLFWISQKVVDRFLWKVMSFWVPQNWHFPEQSQNC